MRQQQPQAGQDSQTLTQSKLLLRSLQELHAAHDSLIFAAPPDYGHMCRDRRSGTSCLQNDTFLSFADLPAGRHFAAFPAHGHRRTTPHPSRDPLSTSGTISSGIYLWPPGHVKTGTSCSKYKNHEPRTCKAALSLPVLSVPSDSWTCWPVLFPSALHVWLFQAFLQ